MADQNNEVPKKIASEAGGFIDWDELEKRFSYRAEFIAKILRSALTSLISENESIRQACDNKDFEALAFSSHSVKGLTGNILATKASQYAADTESKARASDEAVFERATELMAMISQLIDEIKARSA